jgi:2-oxoglutarate dehydrogenase E1 component
MCSGKVYFDLLEAREKLKKDDVILFRIEQLYPFPAKTLVKELKPYAKNAKFYWCQEEPKNMGAWFSVRDYIQWTLETINANNSRNFLYRKKSRCISSNRICKKTYFTTTRNY